MTRTALAARFLSLLLLLGVAVPTVAEAAGDQGERLFEQGLEQYQRQRYDKARERFEKLLALPSGPSSSAGQLMLGRTLFHLSRFEEALAAARRVETRYPGSRYIADGLLLAGDSAYQLGRPREAAAQYARVLSQPGPLVVQSRAAERLAALVKNRALEAQDLQTLRDAVGRDRWREALLFGEARWYERLGRSTAAQAAMAQYRQRFPRGLFLTLAGASVPATAAGVAPAGSGALKVGLLLPLSGPQRQAGEDLRAGAELANDEAGHPLELVVADIGADYGELPVVEGDGSPLLRVLTQTRRLLEDEGVAALVGPLFSADCVAAAALAQAAGVPLIAPLAQQSGLDSVGATVFQLSAVPEVQAAALAEQATTAMGLRRLAVLAPLTDYGWRFAREFVRVADERGGRILHQDWYVPGETRDFSRVFAEIRRAGEGVAPVVAYPAALDTTLGEPTIGADPAAVAELEPEITGIEAIAIVVESFEDARLIAPQLYYHRIRTRILGNDTWYQPEAIRLMPAAERAYLEGVVLVSGYLENHPATRAFTDAFRRKYGRAAGYAAYGYDSIRLLAAAWQDSGGDSATLGAWLAAVQGYDGASGLISFAPGRRANTGLHLLRVDARGDLRPIDDGGTGAGADDPAGEYRVGESRNEPDLAE